MLFLKNNFQDSNNNIQDKLTERTEGLEKLTEEVIFIRQIKTHKCEITGCRKDLFNILFNFPKKHDHVEIAYRDAINHYRKPLVHWATNSKNVLTLPVLKLDEKTTRGIGTYYTEL